MGSDDLFHKRKRKESSLKRAMPRMAPYGRYLIVCEGKKTEPYYFESLIDDYKLGNNVKIAPQTYTCPKQLVEYAINCIRNTSNEYDKIFCVFDKDKHEKYYDALQLARDKKNIITVNSVPCFEYWLILHFEKTTRSFYSNPSKSAGQEAVNYLTRHIHNYRKGRRDIYKITKRNINSAEKRAKIINEYSRSTQNDDPSTNIPELIKALRKLKEDIYG